MAGLKWEGLYAYIHSYIHTYRQTYIQTYIHTYIHIYIHAYIHNVVITQIHTYTLQSHTHIHAYISTYIYKHISWHVHTEWIPTGCRDSPRKRYLWKGVVWHNLQNSYGHFWNDGKASKMSPPSMCPSEAIHRTGSLANKSRATIGIHYLDLRWSVEFRLDGMENSIRHIAYRECVCVIVFSW